jgi:hypothetical protein
MQQNYSQELLWKLRRKSYQKLNLAMVFQPALWRTSFNDTRFLDRRGPGKGKWKDTEDVGERSGTNRMVRQLWGFNGETAEPTDCLGRMLILFCFEKMKTKYLTIDDHSFCLLPILIWRTHQLKIKQSLETAYNNDSPRPEVQWHPHFLLHEQRHFKFQ